MLLYPVLSDKQGTKLGGSEALYAALWVLPAALVLITRDYKPIHGRVSTLLSQDPVEQGVRVLVMLLLRGSLGLLLAEI